MVGKTQRIIAARDSCPPGFPRLRTYAIAREIPRDPAPGELRLGTLPVPFLFDPARGKSFPTGCGARNCPAGRTWLFPRKGAPVHSPFAPPSIGPPDNYPPPSPDRSSPFRQAAGKRVQVLPKPKTFRPGSHAGTSFQGPF